MLGASSPRQGKFSNYFESLPISTNELVPSIVQAPKLELKPLPKTLRYAYLEKEETLPVIITSNLNKVEEEKLIRVLREHRTASGQTIFDI